MNYSQGKEQEVILDFFKDVSRGTFLDCGSNDGIILSNTHALALLGYEGVCVEPSPNAYTKLVENYKGNQLIQCLNYAISDKVGKQLMYDSGTHLNGSDTSLLSTLNEPDYLKWKQTTKFEQIEVETIDVPYLLNISWYDKFDFISCDIEGNDIVFLRQLNLTELGCKIICIEHNGDKKSLDEIKRICNWHGLDKMLLKNSENIIWSI